VKKIRLIIAILIFFRMFLSVFPKDLKDEVPTEVLKPVKILPDKNDANIFFI